MRSSSSRPFPKSRLKLRQLLGLVESPDDSNDPSRGRLLLETLEARQMLAGDVELLFTAGEEDATVPAETGGELTSSRAAEGELAPDLVQFAKDLAASGTVFYGAHWCPACTQQKELFEDGKDNLPFVEVTRPDRTLNETGVAEQITEFPTWVFPDDSRLVGVQSLETLSTRSGVAIPQSEQPTFEPIGETTVQIGSPFHVPVDAYDPDGGPLTVTVSVDNPALVQASVLNGNRSIRIDMQGYGDMVFELFEDRAPRPSGRVADLADADFYDGIIFHRVTEDFVIQAGDPTGTGTSGSTLGNFDDQFHPDLQHNRSGVLSFAKSSDDTNNSQFFITEVPTRFLDGNHSIFGQLVEGEDVREAISFTSTPESRGVGTSQRPDIDVVIDTIDVFEDTENSVVLLKALGTGSTNVTVTVTDQDGNTHEETFLVNAVQDTANTQPFLNDIPDPPTSPRNTPATLQLSSIDVEGDAVTYFAQSLSDPGNGSVTVDSVTGLVTVTPAANFEGTINVQVGVEPGPGVVGNSSSDFDSQTVPFTFSGGILVTPSSVDLETGSDTGSSNVDNVTNAGSLTFTVDGVTDGATVELVEVGSGTVIDSGTVSGSSINITTNNIAALGDGSYEIAARQRQGSTISVLSPSITVVYDTTAPDTVVASAATQANVDRAFQTDLISGEEGSGLIYDLSSAPTGATINAATGVVDWTPDSSQVGTNTFTLELTDAAGNVRSESFNVEVADVPLVGIKLELTDLQGTVIDAVDVGQQFLMRFIGVDLRQFSFDRDGVFAAFADILFDSSLIRPVPGSAIDYADRFPAVNKGTFSDGLIDELGAASDRTIASELEESLIATVRFEALATGSVNIRSEPADESDSEVLLYGIDDLITSNQVEFGSVSLAIGQSFIPGDDVFTVLEDSGTTTLDVLANDAVVAGSGATLSVVSVDPPPSGANVVVENGQVRFTPNPDFNGEVQFTYRVSDTNGVQEDASVTVTVTPVNDPPTGVADTFNVDQNSSNNTLAVLANDSDIDGGQTLTVTDTSDSTEGVAVTISGDGQSVVYTPPADFTGTDTFTYTVSDGTAETTVSVNVTVAPADNPPTAVDDTFPIDEDDAETEYDVLSNDLRDVDDQTFIINSVGVPSQGGSARVSTDGTQFFYAPAANFNGTETVTYTIRDTGGGLSVGTATFTVAAINDPPPVVDTTVETNRGNGEVLALDLTGLPDNVDEGETLTFTNLGTPTAGGSVRIDATTQSIFYTPPSTDFTGNETFTYSVEDGTGLTASGTITVNVSDFTERDIIVNFNSQSTPRINGIRLMGTDALGNSVEVPLTYEDDSAHFDNVLPGEYTVEIPAVPFLQKASSVTSIPVSSAPEDGDMMVDADLGRLRPEFISIQDFLGSAPVKSILVAVAPGQEEVFASPSSSADTIVDPVVALSEAGDSVTIRGKDDSGTDVEATIPTSDSRVQVRGELDGLRLIRVSVEEDDVSFEASPEPSGAEGEFVEGVTQDPPTPSAVNAEPLADEPVLVGQRQPEGESVAAQGVTVADLFVPTVGPPTRTDATVLPLASGDVWVGQSLLENETNDKIVSTETTDSAFAEVSDSLSLVSPSEEEVQSTSSLDEEAIDSVLASEME